MSSLRSLSAAAVCALSGWALTPSVALAQTSPPGNTARPGNGEADRQALALYEEGSAAFAREDYSTAAARFEAAFALSPRPRILYNLGVTYDRLGIPQQAVDAYERYLHQLPNAREREEVETRLRVLRADADLAREQSQGSNNSGAEPNGNEAPRTIVSERVVVRETAPEPAHTARTVGLVLGSLALASTGATVGVYIFASNYYQGLRRDCGDILHMTEPNAPWCSRTLLEDVQLRTTLTNTLLFTSIGLGIASGISFAIDLAQPRPARPGARRAARVGAAVIPANDGATVLVGGAF
jgi:tetratricopeptide (TPR) repeat protein